jgi:deoxyribodipyrimidine photo-lyase
MNIFIFHRDYRLFDNTTLIEMSKKEGTITPIFIFTPEQITKKNKYRSNNSVQFLIESLFELKESIKEYKGKIHFFYGNYMDVIKSFKNVNSIGFNFDYSPYAIKRDTMIKKYCNKNNIKFYCKEDYLLYDILDNDTMNKSGTPYTVFTPYKKHCLQNLIVRKPNKYNNFKFSNNNINNNINNKYIINDMKMKSFYIENKDINVRGGRSNGLKILKNIQNWKDYNKLRDCMIYKTTFMSAYLHFNVLSIREVFYRIIKKLGINNNLINELHWRDFYVNIMYFFPKVLIGMKKGKNKSFREKYDKIQWTKNKKHFDAWKKGMTGFPIVDACMRQMNKTGYMHNRGRMIVASFLVKNLNIDWREGEKYFAQTLVDYDPSSNNGGWQWTSGGGTDAQPYFRIFNPWTQSKKFDPNCKYIKFWIPELKNVDNNDIHKWNIKYNDSYIKPIVEHKKTREYTLKIFKKYLN